MREKIILDDASYDGNLDMALAWLEENAPWWTHKEASDPGITLIELWAILSDMQSYYMDRVQEGHYRKYLKLLGAEPDNGSCAEVWLTVDNVQRRHTVWQGTKLRAEDLVFEAAEETVLTPNTLTAFYAGGEKQEDLIENMRQPRKNRLLIPTETVKEQTLFTMELENPIEPGSAFAFFVLLDERQQRNPTKEEQFRMARISWQYLTDTGWEEAEELADGTKGLLYSGSIRIRIRKHMIKEDLRGGYPLRCVLTGGCFDIIPVLYKIKLNVLRAVQRDTQCMEEYLDYKGEETYSIRHYLGLTGNVDVYVKQAGGYWKDFGQFCEVTDPVAGERKERQVIFSEEIFGKLPPRGRRNVKLVYSSREWKEQYPPAGVTGVAAQKLPLPWKNTDRNSVKLMLMQDEGRRLFKEYVCAEPEEDRISRAWHWDEEEDIIVLGDGRHGEIPKPMEKGAVFTSLCLVKGEQGNVVCGKIVRFQRPDLFPDIRCSNELGGRGGRNRKKASEQFRELTENSALKLKRAVTARDYAALAVQTPGLVLKEASAEMTPQGMVKVRFRLPQKGMPEECIRKYREQVSAFLDRYRLVTVPVSVEAEEGNDDEVSV